MFEDFEFDWNTLGFAVLIWAFFAWMFWFGPVWKKYPSLFSTKLMATIILLPVSYMIVNWINNK